MFFAARDVGEAMRMEQAQPGIRNGPGVAVKFSIVDCDLQAFFKAFFCFLAIVQCFPSNLNETSKRRCQRAGLLLPAVRKLTASGGMAEGERSHLWKTELCTCKSM